MPIPSNKISNALINNYPWKEIGEIATLKLLERMNGKSSIPELTLLKPKFTEVGSIKI